MISLVAGDKDSHWLNCQSNFVIVLNELYKHNSLPLGPIQHVFIAFVYGAPWVGAPETATDEAEALV